MTAEFRAEQIKARKRAATGDPPPSHKMWIRDDWRYLPVFQVPIDALVLNVDNKRFGAERSLVEAKLGRPLDPANNPDDDESIVAILCDSSLDVDPTTGIAAGTPSKDYLALRDDWIDRKQAEPLWIRPDGVVHNGNRRLAMLKRARKDGTDIKWVDAIILDPEDVDDDELFRMEQREQLTEDFKKRYADINALIALRQAAELEGIDWADTVSMREVAGRLKHYAGRDDAAYALTQLQAVKAIDAYLDHIGVPGRYHLASRQVEVFREVGKCMALFDEEADAADLVSTAFSFVQAGKTYLDLRQLRKMFTQDRGRFYELYTKIKNVEDETGWSQEAVSGDVEEPELVAVTAPSEEDGPAEPEPVRPTGYPTPPVSKTIDSALDAFAATLLNINTQLTQAYSRLEAINLDTLRDELAKSAESDLHHLVNLVEEWVTKARGRDET